ncbi:MAG: class II aldolase/adducin family protein [Anaerolineae bacterium]|nr:class II aldolase/adducin family protein [Anaerolineae bacterium]
MSFNPPYPDLHELITDFGSVGERLSELGCCEGGAGNISVCFNWDCDPRDLFPVAEKINLPTRVPELAGFKVVFTGSGVRLREIKKYPAAYLGVAVIEAGGESATIYTAPNKHFVRPTREFNSHLASHARIIARYGSNFHALIHTHPPYLTYLSHIPAYQSNKALSQHVLRWQPEIVVSLPEGLGWVPFCIPGTDELMEKTFSELEKYRIIVWAKHGIMARSQDGLMDALDLVEYAETGARNEYFNLAAGSPGQGLLPDEVKAMARVFKFEQKIF